MGLLSKLLFWRKPTSRPAHSELSNPRIRKARGLKINAVHIKVLKELSETGEIATKDFIRYSDVLSADRRLNDCYHLGLANIVRLKTEYGTRFLYSISDEGKKLI